MPAMKIEMLVSPTLHRRLLLRRGQKQKCNQKCMKRNMYGGRNEVGVEDWTETREHETETTIVGKNTKLKTTNCGKLTTGVITNHQIVCKD